MREEKENEIAQIVVGCGCTLLLWLLAIAILGLLGILVLGG